MYKSLFFILSLWMFLFCFSCTKDKDVEQPTPNDQDSLTNTMTDTTLPCGLNVLLSVSNETVLNANDGKVTALVNGGSAPYMFIWSSGDTTFQITDLSPGNYVVTITDQDGCTYSDSAAVQQGIDPGSPCSTFTLNLQTTDESILNGNDGSILALPSGGTSPYTYTWSSGQSTSEIQNLSVGGYDVTVTDANGCVLTQATMIQAGSDPCLNFMINTSVTNETTQGENDGSAQVNVFGGTAPYTYQWSIGLNSESASNLSPGNYTISVTDQNGCLSTDNFTIEPGAPAVVPFSHDLFDQLLSEHVNNGVVNYNGFISDESQLDMYIDLLSNNVPQNSWSDNKKLAYWINAYNAHAIKIVIDNWPLNSIMDISQSGNNAFDIPFISLGSNTYSLNNIENDIIRVQFNEPRIHFAVNCAAKSCPKLLNYAYTESNLQNSLQQNTIAFINDAFYNTISSNSVEVSQLFNWYGVDFTQNGSVIDYLNQYSNTSINTGATVDFKFYDWSLNN